MSKLIHNGVFLGFLAAFTIATAAFTLAGGIAIWWHVPELIPSASILLLAALPCAVAAAQFLHMAKHAQDEYHKRLEEASRHGDALAACLRVEAKVFPFTAKNVRGDHQ